MKLRHKLAAWLTRPEGATAKAERPSRDLTQLYQLFGTAVIAAGIAILAVRFTHVENRIVVFDMIKYMNAERAVASHFIGDHGSDSAALLLQVSKNIRVTIRQLAGPNTQVFVRQAVIQGEYRDITDEVLTKLGLPTNVPTTDPSKAGTDVPQALFNGKSRAPEAQPSTGASVLP